MLKGFRILSVLLVMMVILSLGMFSVCEGKTKVAKPVKLCIIDVAGNLQLSKDSVELFKDANPDLVSDIEYIKATAPELASKIKAQQMAGNLGHHYGVYRL